MGDGLDDLAGVKARLNGLVAACGEQDGSTGLVDACEDAGTGSGKLAAHEVPLAAQALGVETVETGDAHGVASVDHAGKRLVDHGGHRGGLGLLLGVLELLDGGKVVLNALHNLAGSDLEQVGGSLEAGLLLVEEGKSVEGGHSLDAAHVGCDGTLGDDLDQAALGGVGHMRAAAQLAGESLDVDDAHLGAVLLTEKRGGAAGAGLVDTHNTRGHRQGGHDLLVGDALDLGKLGGAHSLEVCEVEAQTRRLHERAGLVDMGAEHLAQGGVQDVRGGVVAGDAGAGHRVDGGGALVTGVDGAVEHLAVMDGEDLLGIGGTQNLELEAVGLDEAGVAALAALLSVEGGALE